MFAIASWLKFVARKIGCKLFPTHGPEQDILSFFSVFELACAAYESPDSQRIVILGTKVNSGLSNRGITGTESLYCISMNNAVCGSPMVLFQAAYQSQNESYFAFLAKLLDIWVNVAGVQIVAEFIRLAFETTVFSITV